MNSQSGQPQYLIKISNIKLKLFPTPNTESVAYEFGAGRGLIQYQFPSGNQPDTEEDNIALGFITLKADAVLLRIESSNTQDYFELEIVSPA